MQQLFCALFSLHFVCILSVFLFVVVIIIIIIIIIVVVVVVVVISLIWQINFSGHAGQRTVDQGGYLEVHALVTYKQ